MGGSCQIIGDNIEELGGLSFLIGVLTKISHTLLFCERFIPHWGRCAYLIEIDRKGVPID